MAVGSQGPLRADARLNAAHHDIPALAGQLLLFPSRLDHAVLENSSEELRLSIAFDLVLSAPLGPCSSEYLSPHPSLWDPLSQDGQLMP
jgi:ectoine hydroxylase-related dioxygenase (phytanoyl-CoA dioxygenase family)